MLLGYLANNTREVPCQFYLTQLKTCHLSYLPAKLCLKPMKIERKVFHRRDAEHAEMIHLFSLPLRRRQRKMVMPFGQGLIDSNNLREALGLSLFCPLSRKRKNVFLCDLCASSEAGVET
jgi:hypothetical protein